MPHNGAGSTQPAANRPAVDSGRELGATRANLVREAQRVGKLRKMNVSDVIDHAAKGAFQFAGLQRLTPDSLPALKAAIDVPRQVEQ
jgi:hypothetical protein